MLSPPNSLHVEDMWKPIEPELNSSFKGLKEIIKEIP
jgi:hypothetical protein